MQPVEVIVTDQIDLSNIPLSALSSGSVRLLSGLLNSKKVFKSENGYCRDWRGLFQALGLAKHHHAALQKHEDPTKEVLNLWLELANEAKIEPNLMQLQNALGIIDRWDVLDDSNELFYKDAERFLADRHNMLKSSNADTLGNQQKTICRVADEDIFTRDDTPTKKQYYDAFVLFADADIAFASKIVDHLEQKGLKLCIKDRDILGGTQFEHKTIMNLITDRCHRLVVVYSMEFAKSPLDEFLVTYTQALQIAQKQRKLIPCVYERINLPTYLKYLYVLDYKRSNNLYNFWDKLEEAIKPQKERPMQISKPVVSPVATAPEIVVDPVENSASVDTEHTLPEDVQGPVHPAIQRLDSQQPMKKSFSSWDFDKLFTRVLTNKSKASSSSASDLPAKVESGEQGMKNWKRHFNFGLSSSKSSLDGTGDKCMKKKHKWYKSNKTKVTNL